MTFRGQPGQLAAIANLRWRLFVNSLRTSRGKLELVSHVVVSLAFALGGLGGAFGLAAGALYFVSHDQPELLALFLWPVSFFWQMFPVAATAFTKNPDSSDLLRFPLSYRSYFLVRLAYGAFDAATLLGCLWLFGIFVGVSVAKPALLPSALLVLLLFAAFNLVLQQMIFAWIERWLAQRRTREIMGILFVLCMLSFQLVGPLLQHFGGRARPQFRGLVNVLVPVQGALPPGLAANAIAQASRGQFPASMGSLFLLGVVAMLMGYLLHLRLRAQFRGENLSEAAAARSPGKKTRLRFGWRLPGFSQPIAAVFEKEARYLGRSGPMLLTLIMPIFVLIVFRLGPARHTEFFQRAPNLAFPGVAGYALLVLTNLIYNNFGGDAGGIQLFYAAPVPFRQIVLAKNLTHCGVLLVEMVLAWLASTYLYGAPALDVTGATITAVLFAAPLNFAVGNLLSMYSPKKLDFSTFGRQRASQLTVLVSLGVQIVIIGTGIVVFVVGRLYQNYWMVAAVFLALALVSFSIYAMVLQRIDGIALEKRETLIAELCRA